MSHDQLAKTLIATFFPDFLRLTLPDSVLRLRLGEATFLAGSRESPDRGKKSWSIGSKPMYNCRQRTLQSTSVS